MAITTRTVREMPSAFSIENILEPEKHLVKVCAYARVSTDRDEQEESFERQCEHYRAYINANWEWEFCGVYADQGITGTKAEKRPEFMRLISDCLNNKIDKVLVKSISRFARNTVDALKYIRLLKDKNISVYFETNKIDTLTPGGEVLITVLAAMAEEESRSMSSNIKWSFRKKHERGEYTLPATMMGYKKAANGDGYEIVPEEAKIIQRIFREYVGGMTTTQIAKALRDDNIKTPMGNSKWTAAGVAAKLANEKYMGAAILGKTYKPDLLSTRRVNNGEAPRYYVEHGHPAIVSKELYELAQMEKQARNTANDEAIGSGKYSSKYPFSGLLVCNFCHAKYRRHLRTISGKKVPSWGCITHITKGNDVCQNHHINEATLEEAYRKVIKETMKDSSMIMQSLEQMIKEEMNPSSAEQVEDVENKILKVQEQVLTLRKSKQSGSISQTDYEEQIRYLGAGMKALEEEKESMSKDTSDYLKATMWLKDFNEHIKEGNILTDGDQYIMKKLLKEIVVEDRKTVNFIFKCGIEKRITL